MKEVLKKINEARQKIKASNIRKSGHNKHSNYDYYTPEQISKLVNDACLEVGLFNDYELIRDEYGLKAKITVYDLNNPEDNKVYNFATEMPQITATNAAQQLGGCMTYSERYGLMFIYDIKDNNLDFDTDQKQEKKEPKQSQTNFEVRELTQSEVETKWNGKIYKGNIVYINDSKVQPTNEQIEKLKSHPKFKP